jgi:polyribonucleotide nucleotidyltransferase
MGITTHEITVGDATLTFQLGKVARQANGSCTVRLGDTMVLVTACAEPSKREGIDFLPLTVDYRENTYAGGRIPGGFFKREGRPTEREILTCRLIDRPLRPLFADGWTQETQVIGFVQSADGENDPDVLALTGASLALMVAPDIPFTTPMAGVRIGRVDGELVLFPTHEQRDTGDLDLVVAGTEDAIVMVECSAGVVDESVILDALDLAHREIRKIVALQHEIVRERGIVQEPFEAPPVAWPETFESELRARWTEPLREALHVRGKFTQRDAVKAVRSEAIAALPEDEAAVQQPWAKKIFESMVKDLTRETILDRRQRLDGRAFDEVREVTCEVSLLPRTHGSSLFTRGETQALATCTLGTSEDAQVIEAFEGESHQRFLLHYNFPPFSVGEVKFLRGPGRREIGHGNLARRALLPVLPSEADFPYTLRVVSDILESNGSSSMATVCGGTLAMMDAGVPITTPVAGVAMGLVSDGSRHAVLTDIAGQEDHYGDMDFKVAGTEEGITALQMDIKVAGLDRSVMEQALAQAKDGRLHILGRMRATIHDPRPDLSQYAPRIFQMHVDPDLIRHIIGPGGKTIRSIVDRTGARINVDDDGTVQIATDDGDAAQQAIEIIESIVKQPAIGEVYEGTVKRLEPYGAFVEILPNQDGLLHISELAMERTPDIHDVLDLGDTIRVKIIDIDGNDRIKLSHRVLLEEEARARGEDIPRREDNDRPPRDRRGGDRRSGDRKGGRGGGGGRGGRGGGGGGGRGR